MYNNINFDINNSQPFVEGHIQGLQNVDGENVLPQIETTAGANLQTTVSEDEFVEFNDFEDAANQRQQEINLLLIEYNDKMNEYFRYQNELLELQRQYDEIQNKILNANDEDEKKRLQTRASNISGQISDMNDKISAANLALNDINAQIYSAMCDVSYYTEAATAPSYSTGAVSAPAQTQGGNFTAQNVQYSGNSIPKDLALKLDNRLGQGFSQKCERVAAEIGCDTGDLLAMMYSESGLRTDARNKSSNAIGLIQFIPSTLKGNGYSTEQVANMSAIEQLDVVKDIFMKAKKMAGYGANEKIDGGTLYAINWLPAYAKRDTIVSSGEKYYSRGLDMNKDGSVTKNDLAQRLQSKYNEMINNI